MWHIKQTKTHLINKIKEDFKIVYYGVDENGRVLQRYGVPGMRWGHHKRVDPNGELSAYGRKKFASGVTGYDAEKQIRKAEDKTFKKNGRNYTNLLTLAKKKQKLQDKQKGGDDQKYTNKINRLDFKIGKNKNELKQGSDFVNKVVAANNAKGFKTTTIDAIREARSLSIGRTFLGALSLATIGIGGFGENSALVKTKKTVVTNKDTADPWAARRKYTPRDDMATGFPKFDYKVKKRLEKQKKKYPSVDTGYLKV